MPTPRRTIDFRCRRLSFCLHCRCHMLIFTPDALSLPYGACRYMFSLRHAMLSDYRLAATPMLTLFRHAIDC